MTNTTKPELLALAGRVEAGKDVSAEQLYSTLKPTRDNWLDVPSMVFIESLNGSIDATKALHDAVLPGWHVDIHIQGGFNSHVIVGHDKPSLQHHRGRATTPAAAWVAAILRAKAGID